MIGRPPNSLTKSSIHSAVIKILEKSKRPMTVTEITKKVSKQMPIKGKTPTNTIFSILQRSNFVTKTGVSTFKLKRNI